MKPCWTPQQLERFLLDQLSGRETEAIEAHIEGCERCRRLLEEITRRPGTDRTVDLRPERTTTVSARLLERVEAKGPRRENPDERHLHRTGWVPGSETIGTRGPERWVSAFGVTWGLPENQRHPDHSRARPRWHGDRVRGRGREFEPPRGAEVVTASTGRSSPNRPSDSSERLEPRRGSIIPTSCPSSAWASRAGTTII